MNYKVKYNHCDDFIRCFDGALISSDVNTLNSSGSDTRKNVDRGTTVVFLLVNMEKNTMGNTCFLLVFMKKTLLFFIGRHEKKHKG